HCKREATQDAESWNALTHGFDRPLPATVCEPVGCLECRHTGFMGRTGVYEMLPMTPPLRARIGAELALDDFVATAQAEGMQPLRISAAAHVARGLTTVAEVLTVLPPPA